MQDRIEIKKIKEEFKKELEKSKENKEFNHIKIINLENNKNIQTTPKEKSNLNLTKLIPCSKNYFENLIRIHTSGENNLEITENKSIEIEGSGILNLIIKNDISLYLNFKSNKTYFPYIKILIEKNINLELIELSNSKQLYKNIEIITNENSKINSAQIILNSKININEIKLNENSKYKLNSTYNIKNNEIFIENKVIHKNKNSESNMVISGVANENSKIISNGLIKIEKNAPNSIAHQKLKNLILYSNSEISSDPILEVENSKVICSHASSISKLNEEIIFYLKSKGINYKNAKKLIITGYLNEVINTINHQNIKKNIKIGTK